MVNVRPALADDCVFILELIRELASFEKLSHQVVATPELLHTHLFGSTPKAHALIAELDGKKVAFALYFYNFSTFLSRPGIYLEDLYVKEEFRSHGIGLSLLKELAKIAKSEKLGRLEWSVLDWNQKAINFYLGIGAKPMDEWTVYRMDELAIERLAAD